MYEMKGISPSIGVAIIILTQQLIYKNRIEKHNVNLDIFVTDTTKARNLPNICLD